MPTEPSDLPDDVDALRALLLSERAQRQSERAERQSESATAKIEVARRDAELTNRLIEIEHLKAMLAKLRRGKYGSSSEKLDAEIRQLELWVDDAEISLAAAEDFSEKPCFCRCRNGPLKRPQSRKTMADRTLDSRSNKAIYLSAR